MSREMPRYVMRENGSVVCIGDTVRIGNADMTGEVVDLSREAHPRGAWLAHIRWGNGAVSAWLVESVTVTATPWLAYSTGGTSLPGGLAYVNERAVTGVFADAVAPHNPSVSGYGGKIPSRYRVRLQDGRTRRVYVMRYGNSGSPYIRIGGRTVHLGWQLEERLTALR